MKTRNKFGIFTRHTVTLIGASLLALLLTVWLNLHTMHATDVDAGTKGRFPAAFGLIAR